MKEQNQQNPSFEYYDGSTWTGYSPKQMRCMYPQGGYSVAGEVVHKKGREKSCVIYNEEGEKLFLQPPGTYSGLFYKTEVFLPYETDVFIAAKKTTLPFIIIIFAAVACLAIAVLASLGFLKGGPDIDPGASKYESSLKRPDGTATSEILMPGYDDWSMEAGTDKIYMALMNPEDNPCYFQFTITREDNGDELFRTKLVPPGSAVTEIKLPNKLKKGIYPIVVSVKCYSLEDPERELNGAEVKTKIIAVG